MDARGLDLFVPVCDRSATERRPLLDRASGNVQRGIAQFPRGGWTVEMAYEKDVERLIHGPVEDPGLRFR